jgi:hypothetical protein
MGVSNFGVDTSGRPVVFDFAEIGWLPESLGLYTLLRTTSFAKKVAAHMFGVNEVTRLSAQLRTNLDAIARVSSLLGMTFPLSMFTHLVWDTVMTLLSPDLDNNGYEIK